MQKAKNRKGKGIGYPGAGIHAVFLSFIT